MAAEIPRQFADVLSARYRYRYRYRYRDRTDSQRIFDPDPDPDTDPDQERKPSSNFRNAALVAAQIFNEMHMNPFDWLSEYRRRLADEHRDDEHRDDEGQLVRDADHQGLAPARRLRLEAEDWGAAARIAAAMGLRHAGVFADPPDVAPSVAPNAATADLDDQPTIRLRAVLEQQGDYLVLETQVPLALPELPSQTPWYPGLDRL